MADQRLHGQSSDCDCLAPQGLSTLLDLEGTAWQARPLVPREVRELIRIMSRENPIWGAPRIHGELLKLGIDIGETSVSKYMVRRERSLRYGEGPIRERKAEAQGNENQRAVSRIFLTPAARNAWLRRCSCHWRWASVGK